MFSMIRKRVTYTNVAMTVALVFAMSGGAFAAGKYLITSTKQISPKVLKSLQGKAGANGATGAVGPAGAAGPAGPQGPKGDTGAAGANGTNGTNGEPGKEGVAGKEGSPWTAGGTLPSKATETGTWSVQTPVNNKEQNTEQTIKNVEDAEIAISFPIRLKESLNVEHTVYVEREGNGKECPGNAEVPMAKPGYLCVYEGVLGGNDSNHAPTFIKPGIFSFNPEELEGAGTTGAIMNITAIVETRPEGEKIITAIGGHGTWAVTAP